MIRPTAPTAPSATDIDRDYGLDPVLETGRDPRFSPVTRFISVTCPYCGGVYDSAVDVTQGDHQCIEDCQVCCSSIELRISLDADKRVQIDARRSDDA